VEITALTADHFNSWDEFCLESDDAWFWHTTSWLSYCTSYGEKLEAQNLSFMITDTAGILAVCPLLMEKKIGADNCCSYEFSTSGGGGPGILPALRNDLSADRREKIMKILYEKVDALAKRHGVVKAAFRTTPLAPRPCQFNLFLKYGYLDGTLNTQIIDLSLPAEHLWSAIRKGHRYDIHRGERYYRVQVYDRENHAGDAFDHYRLLHHKTAGRVTRPPATFEMMDNWIASGQGMLCAASREGRFAGFAYLVLYKDGAYYASASDDPDFETDVPVSHVMQWTIINRLQKQGYRKYEIGIQQFGPQMQDLPTTKDLSISFFKRGFGGKTVPIFRGIKYYDETIMETDLRNNLNNLLSCYRI
jgi:hypothetical protein